MIEIISDLNEMQSLAAAWNALADWSKNPLLRHEWFAACAEAFCEPGQLRIAISKTTGGIAAIAPLALTQRHGLEGLEILGASLLGEPGGFIYREKESLEESIHGVIKMGRPVLLSRLRCESPEVSVLQRAKNKGAFIIVRDSVGSPFLSLAAEWAEFEARMSSRHRYDLRRARKRAEEVGQVSYEIVSPGPDVLDHYLEELYQVEAAGWKGRNGTAMLFDERMKRFFRVYSRAACGLGTLRLCFLRLNDKPVAVMLAVEIFNRFWVLKIGYDEAFSRCSPGILLVHETIRHAFEKKLETYEFLGNDADWMHMWTKQQHPYVTARIYPFSIVGHVGLGMDTIFALGGRALKMLSG